jgi:pyruvate/2-oxoglutarate dehydrogenase complex dihydrolipoamide acyltransferase (E2) component
VGELFEVRAPVENVNDETIAILKWLVGNGDKVEKNASLLLAETTKTSFDVPSPADGFVWKVAADEGEVPTGAVLCYVGEDLEAVKRAAARETVGVSELQSAAVSPAAAIDRVAAAVSSPAPAAEQAAAPATTRFSGKALALIKSFGLDPNEFAGHGLVRERDVLDRVQKQKPAMAAEAPPERAVPAPEPRVSAAPVAGIETRAESLPRSKRLEGQYLRTALASTVPSIATVAVRTTGFFSRSRSREDLVGLPGAAVIFEASRLLRAYPVFNAVHDHGTVRYYQDVNIGYAFDLGKGLKVPVIRNADGKSLLDIAAEKQQRLVEYLNDCLPVDTLSGGTFTITDLSGDDVFHFNPVLNQGQSAILGVCAEFFPDGSKQGLFNVVLAFDHQVAEGRTAAAFLRDLRDRLQGHEQAFGRMADETLPEPRCSVCLRPVSELDTNHQFLIRTIADRSGADKAICSVCLQV